MWSMVATHLDPNRSSSLGVAFTAARLRWALPAGNRSSRRASYEVSALGRATHTRSVGRPTWVFSSPSVDRRMGAASNTEHGTEGATRALVVEPAATMPLVPPATIEE